MKTGILSILFLTLCALAPRVSAQPGPGLGLQVSSSGPTLSLTGTVGTVYSIQYTAGLSPTNLWVDRTLLQAGNVWTDPDVPTRTQRFYRAVSVAAPADTNLVFIQPGTFTMGSPLNEFDRASDETQHTVTISRGFWMEKFLVSQGDYLLVVRTNPSYFRNGTNGTAFGGTAGAITDELVHPVEQVTWFEATNYCALRTQQERAGGLIPTNYAYRLPTESEWEYASRAGTTTALYLGSGLQSGEANFNGHYEYGAALTFYGYDPSGILLGITTPVGSYPANPWGLYDMMGNVWEWCQDWYSAYPGQSVIDPQGPASAHDRVVRGGGLAGVGGDCRSAARLRYYPWYRHTFIGFRVVLASSQP